jgi:hypothetical protein
MEQILIFVTNNFSNLNVDLKINDLEITVKELKKILKKKFNLEDEEFNLIFNNKILKEEKKLKHYNIGNEDKIILIKKEKNLEIINKNVDNDINKEKKIENNEKQEEIINHIIYVRFDEVNLIKIKDFNIKIKDFKKILIEKIEKLKNLNFFIYYNEEIFYNNDTLISKNITDECTLFIIIKNKIFFDIENFNLKTFKEKINFENNKNLIKLEKFISYYINYYNYFNFYENNIKNFISNFENQVREQINNLIFEIFEKFENKIENCLIKKKKNILKNFFIKNENKRKEIFFFIFNNIKKNIIEITEQQKNDKKKFF